MKTVPTWGYKAGDAQIFDLKEGESLPDGWVDSPANVGAVKAAPAEPVPERAPEENAYAQYGEAKDWRQLHWKQRVKMAKDLTGNMEITSPEEADAAIEAHLNG